MRLKRREFLAAAGGAAASLAMPSSMGFADEHTGREGRGMIGEAQGPDAAVAYLEDVMDRFHRTIDVYTDSDAPGNHFVARGRMPVDANNDTTPPMVEACTDSPNSGITCIKASFHGSAVQALAPNVPAWGGWYFMNGMLQGAERVPSPNWGQIRHAGVDLNGAVTLTFYARGAEGGEGVEFFCGGIRTDAMGNPVPHPDSAEKRSKGITLTKEWKQYTINLTGLELHAVLGGFGWAVDANRNGLRDITFYIDDIQYNLDAGTRTQRLAKQPRFLRSYEVIASTNDFDLVMRNAAFVYDNALALMAFLASGKPERAGMIADALVYAQGHDRLYEDDRIRTAYQAGDLVLPNGWTPYGKADRDGKADRVRTPGWVDPDIERWIEDSYMMGFNTGNVAWVMLALLAYHAHVARANQARDSIYLLAVKRLGEWIDRSRRDTRGEGGYRAGLDGNDDAPRPLRYKATEHNLDLYAAFQRLFLLTGEPRWQERANHAKRLVLKMWDGAQGRFLTGTKEDGVTPNQDVIPVDIQAWVLLSLRQEARDCVGALTYAEQNHRVGKGYTFGNADLSGVWYEGTAQMAAAYAFTNQNARNREILDFLTAEQIQGMGAMYAASKDGLNTGFLLSNGQPWLYYRRPHVGATAWYILAARGVNPFWMGNEALAGGR